MKTFLNLVALVACMLALAALPCRAVSFLEERFDYPVGQDLVSGSGGKWHYWQGNPPAPVITNLHPYGSSGTHIALDQQSQEALWFFTNIFENSTQAIVGFSFAAVSSTNEDYYVFFCSGDPAAQNSGYAGSGLGGFIINGVTPPVYTNIVSLHFWNTFGVFEISLNLSAALPGQTPPWHDVRAVMYKTTPGGVTGGYARIYVDGTYYGVFPFPLQNVDNLVTGVLNTVDLYQAGPDDSNPASRLLIDNIFIEDRQQYLRYVSPTGSDANDGLTPASPLRTIGEALWRIPSGTDDRKSVISIAPGVYSNEYSIRATTNFWKYGLYIRKDLNDRPNCYDVTVMGAGAHNTILHQDFSTVPGITNLEQTMGFYIRDLKGWTVQDLQVRITTNMPQDAWSWFYGAFGALMGCRDSSFLRCIAAMPVGWAKGKPGFHLNAGSNITLQGCASFGGGMGMNVASSPQAPLNISYNTFVDISKGVSEGNAGVAIVFNGGSGSVTRCLVANAERGGILGGIGDVVHSVWNNYFNCGTNATPGTNFYDSGNVIPNGDIYQVPLFDFADGFPYRCGAGNIGYMSGLSTVYVDPAAPSDITLGLSPATAFKSIPAAIQRHRGGIDASQMARLLLMNGVHFNPSNYVWNNMAICRFSTPYLDVHGESVAGTIILYSNTGPVHAGLNLSGAGMQLRDLTVRRDDLVTGWSWFSALVESWFASDTVISNVQILQPGAGASAQPCIHYYSGNNKQAFHTLCYGGTVGAAVNVANVSSYFYNCTFVNNNGSGDPSGQSALTLLDAGQYIYAEKCIIQDNTNVVRPLNATATIVVNDSITNNVPNFVSSGAPGTAIGTGIIAANPYLATYQGRRYASPLAGYGWFGRPPSAQAAGGWPRSRADRYNSSLSQAECSTLYTQSWSAPLVLYTPNDLKSRSGHLALDTSKIVVMTPDATLCAYCRSTGTQLWNYSIGLSAGQWTVGGDPLILEDGSVLAAGSNHMWRFNADGTLMWKTQVRADGWVATPVAVSPDCSTAYAMGVFGSSTNALVAFDVATGAVQWRFHVPGARFGAMAVDSTGTIYFGSTVDWGGAGGGSVHDRIIYAVTATGTLKWTCAITNEMMQGLVLSTDESKLFCKTFDDNGYICALDAATGVVLWKVSLGPNSHAFPDIARDAQNNLYGAGAGGFAKWDASGVLHWTYTSYADPYCPAISSNGLVWFRAQNVTNALIGVNALDGTQVALLPINGESGEEAWAVPAIDDEGNVYVATRYTLFRYAIVPEPALGALAALALLLVRRRR